MEIKNLEKQTVKEKIESRIDKNVKTIEDFYWAEEEKVIIENENKFLKELLNDLYAE